MCKELKCEFHIFETLFLSEFLYKLVNDLKKNELCVRLFLINDLYLGKTALLWENISIG